MVTVVAKRVAKRTEDAYSFRHYRIREWTRIAQFLLDEEYSVDAVEQILRSKFMRWAADGCDDRWMTLEKFKPYFHENQKGSNGIDAMLRDEFGLPKTRWEI